MPSTKSKGGAGSATRSLRGLIGGNRKNKDKNDGENGSVVSSASDSKSMQSSNKSIIFDDAASSSTSSSLLPSTRTISNLSESNSNTPTNESQENSGRGRGGNIIQRLRERSRSRSRAKTNGSAGGGGSSGSSSSTREMLVAVTSCRSDGYYNQKAPGSTFKLPRKAPTNLKLFHELAVGVKDAYAAVGATPRNPNNLNNNNSSHDDHEEQQQQRAAPDENTLQARMILWDFIGNLDFVSFGVSLTTK
jgi:hypothetical protein